MSVETSNFYANLQKLEGARQTGITNLGVKGVTVAPTASIPTIMNKILSMESVAIQTQNTTITTNGNAVIVTAEMPGITIKLFDGETLIESKTTDATYGGPVTFSLSSTAEKTYTLQAVNSESTILWTNTITVNGIGIYNCKTGKAFADYTPEEVNRAAKNHYAKYMWSVGDTRMISTVGSSKKWAIAGFEHDDKAAGGKAGLTMVMESYTGATYKHWNSNDNTIGWEGSLIRLNGLKANSVYYTKAAVTSTTEGTYYVWDTELEDWAERTLPSQYNSEEFYYTQNLTDADGAFITGLPDWSEYMLNVSKKTADAGSGFKKIIKSSSFVFSLSDGEVFGNNGRTSTRYSQHELEGEQYEYFKNFTDGKVRLGSGWWLRSPYSGNATCFCCCYNNGYAYNYNASITNYARLAFCL